jgi:hypothetical protein
VFVSSAAALAWQAAPWPPSQTPDAWAYIAWGQGLARGEGPVYDHALTTPKPLGFVMGLAVSPIRADRAMQVLVIGFLALLAAALFQAAYRRAGTVGAIAALGALGLSAVIGVSARNALVDGVATGLIMLALVTRGRTRLGSLLVLGLARPEAWPLAGIAAFTDTAGSLRRRALAGIAATVAAPLVWVLVDFAFTGDLLASTHRARAINDLTQGGVTPSVASLPGSIASGVADEVGLAVALIGIAGLVVLTALEIRKRDVDPLPIAVIVIWVLGIVAETHNLPFKSRFMFPIAPALWLGFAVAAGAILLWKRPGGPIVAAIATSAAFIAGTTTMPTPLSKGATELAAMPTIGRALTCGPMRVSGHAIHSLIGHYPRAVVPVLAAETHRSLNRFVLSTHGGDPQSELILDTRKPPPGWTSHPLAFGTLALSPGCRAAIGPL